MFAPENGNMLGGVMVNLTGPCFEPGTRVTCRFEPDTVYVSSHMGNEERCPHRNVNLVFHLSGIFVYTLTLRVL